MTSEGPDGHGGTFRRGAAGLVSQVLSTASSLSLTFFIARSVDAGAFGSWSLAYVAYITGMHLSRSIISTPVLLEGRGRRASRPVVQGAAAATLGIGVILGAGMFLGGGLLDSIPMLRIALWSFAVSVPAVILQDTLRHVFFRNSQPWMAVWIDLVRLMLQLCFFVAVESTVGAGLATATVAWGISAGVSSIMGLVILRTWPSFRAGSKFVSDHRGEILRLGADSSLVTFATHALPLVVGATSGLAAVGHLRAGQSLLGGIGIVVMGLTPIATIEARRHLDGAGRRWSVVGVWSLVIGVLAFIYGGVLLLLPDEIALELVGDSWAGASGLLLPLVLQAVIRGPATGVPIVLRAEARIGDVLKLRSMTMIPTLGIPALGAWWAGAVGAAWGILVATVVVGIISSLRLPPGRRQ